MQKFRNVSLCYLILYIPAITFYGCASCPVQTFDKITLVDEVEGVHAYADGPRHLILNVLQDVRVDVGNCWESGVCLKISLPKGRRLRLTTNKFAELDVESRNEVQIHEASQIYYDVTCEERRSMLRTCRSSESSPTSVPVDVVDTSDASHDDWKWQYYKKSFSSTLEFEGASEIYGSLLLPLFSIDGLREYQLPVFMARDGNVKPYILRLPSVEVDGAPQKLPDILFIKVSKPLCSYRAW